jgi:dTDP-4-dehydrorhamnose reductase
MHVLIIGGDGAIGATLAGALRDIGHEVTVTSRRDGAAQAVAFDLAAPDLEALPAADVTVICAAMARFEDCRTKPDLAQQVNVTAPAAIAQHCRRQGKRLILLSTSAVFDCLIPKRKASDVRLPRSAYGRLKVAAENAVLAQGAGMSVLRLTKILRADDGIFPRWIAALGQGRTVTAFAEHTLCPLPMAAVIDALVALVIRDSDGVYQVSGEDDISYAAAARELAVAIGESARKVNEVPAGSAGLLADEITPHTSLDTARFSVLTGFAPPKARDVLREVYGLQIARCRAIAAEPRS